MLGPVDQLEEQHDGALDEEVEAVPPGCRAIIPGRIRVIWDKFQHLAGGVDARCSGGAVEVLGFARLVRDLAIETAEAGPIDRNFDTVVEEAESAAFWEEGPVFGGDIPIESFG